MRADLSFGGNRSDRSNVIRDAQVIGEPFSASSCGPETGFWEMKQCIGGTRLCNAFPGGRLVPVPTPSESPSNQLSKDCECVGLWRTESPLNVTSFLSSRNPRNRACNGFACVQSEKAT